MTSLHKGGVQGAGWLNIVLGALAIASPFYAGFGTDDGLTWSNLVTGFLVVVFAGYNVYAANKRHTERAFGPALVNVLLGAWLAVSPFVYATGGLMTTLNIVFGLVLIAAAAYNAWAASDARHARNVA